MIRNVLAELNSVCGVDSFESCRKPETPGGVPVPAGSINDAEGRMKFMIGVLASVLLISGLAIVTLFAVTF
jgi:hypothetical protein